MRVCNSHDVFFWHFWHRKPFVFTSWLIVFTVHLIIVHTLLILLRKRLTGCRIKLTLWEMMMVTREEEERAKLLGVWMMEEKKNPPRASRGSRGLPSPNMHPSIRCFSSWAHQPLIRFLGKRAYSSIRVVTFLNCRFLNISKNHIATYTVYVF